MPNEQRFVVAARKSSSSVWWRMQPQAGISRLVMSSDFSSGERTKNSAKWLKTKKQPQIPVGLVTVSKNVSN